jgi:hypothetical protein
MWLLPQELSQQEEVLQPRKRWPPGPNQQSMGHLRCLQVKALPFCKVIPFFILPCDFYLSKLYNYKFFKGYWLGRMPVFIKYIELNQYIFKLHF